jgi:hypothetical protein
MLSAVDLDHEEDRRSAEVDHERPDWMLPTELDAHQVVTPELHPEPLLGIC